MDRAGFIDAHTAKAASLPIEGFSLAVVRIVNRGRETACQPSRDVVHLVVE